MKKIFNIILGILILLVALLGYGYILFKTRIIHFLLFYFIFPVIGAIIIGLIIESVIELWKKQFAKGKKQNAINGDTVTVETSHYSIMIVEDFDEIRINIFSKNQELLNYFKHKHGYKKKDCGFLDD